MGFDFLKPFAKLIFQDMTKGRVLMKDVVRVYAKRPAPEDSRHPKLPFAFCIDVPGRTYIALPNDETEVRMLLSSDITVHWTLVLSTRIPPSPLPTPYTIFWK